MWMLSASVLLTSSADVPESRMTCLAELGNCSPAPGTVPPATCRPARPTTQYLRAPDPLSKGRVAGLTALGM